MHIHFICRNTHMCRFLYRNHCNHVLYKCYNSQMSSQHMCTLMRRMYHLVLRPLLKIEFRKMYLIWNFRLLIR